VIGNLARPGHALTAGLPGSAHGAAAMPTTVRTQLARDELRRAVGLRQNITSGERTLGWRGGIAPDGATWADGVHMCWPWVRRGSWCRTRPVWQAGLAVVAICRTHRAS